MIEFQPLFTDNLPGDPQIDNSRRQVSGACYSFVNPTPCSKPALVAASPEVGEQLGLKREDIYTPDFVQIFSGNLLMPKARPYAMCYGGHQFGHWAGQLGDGRVINLGEYKTHDKILSVQLKGAGPTPYSRNADGLAVLRSSIREFMCSEAMFYLGVPTTRALSVITTGEQVWRDVLYDGNPAFEPGAVVCRVAPGFLRFGNYEIFAARGEIDILKQLTDFTLTTYFPELGKPGKETYIEFFREVSRRTLDMVIHWLRVGFVHGVMNTDNMSILGLTIDYGPYGWLEAYDEAWTPNSTDAQGRRYAFGQQANIALWNLWKLANALYPLIQDVNALKEVLEDFSVTYGQRYKSMMASKLGWMTMGEKELALLKQLLPLMSSGEVDFTIFFRTLADLKIKDPVRPFFDQLRDQAFYGDEAVVQPDLENWLNWIASYQKVLIDQDVDDQDRKLKMDAVNPKYVLRNYMAHLAIEAASKGDHGVPGGLMEMLKNPYDEQPKFQHWFAKSPAWAREKVGCSMLSCSS